MFKQSLYSLLDDKALCKHEGLSTSPRAGLPWWEVFALRLPTGLSWLKLCQIRITVLPRSSSAFFPFYLPQAFPLLYLTDISNFQPSTKLLILWACVQFPFPIYSVLHPIHWGLLAPPPLLQLWNMIPWSSQTLKSSPHWPACFPTVWSLTGNQRGLQGP